MTLMDIILIVIFVGFLAWSVVQRFVRQLLEVVIFYVATAAAGLLYLPATNFFSAMLGDSQVIRVIMFWVVFILAWVVLDVAGRKSFPDVRLIKLRFMDGVLALLPGFLCSLILISLLYTTIGYTGLATRGGSWDEAALRPLLTQFLDFYMFLHRLWFPSAPSVLATILP